MALWACLAWSVNPNPGLVGIELGRGQREIAGLAAGVRTPTRNTSLLTETVISAASDGLGQGRACDKSIVGSSPDPICLQTFHLNSNQATLAGTREHNQI